MEMILSTLTFTCYMETCFGFFGLVPDVLRISFGLFGMRAMLRPFLMVLAVSKRRLGGLDIKKQDQRAPLITYSF